LLEEITEMETDLDELAGATPIEKDLSAAVSMFGDEPISRYAQNAGVAPVINIHVGTGKVHIGDTRVDINESVVQRSFNDEEEFDFEM